MTVCCELSVRTSRMKFSTCLLAKSCNWVSSIKLNSPNCMKLHASLIPYHQLHAVHVVVSGRDVDFTQVLMHKLLCLR